MDYAMQPWKTLSATACVGVLTEGWNLTDSPDLSVPRVFTLQIPFAEPFHNAPVVQVGLTGFDIDHAFSGRLSLQTSDITSTGFALSICTWMDTKVYSVEFSWLAIGA